MDETNTLCEECTNCTWCQRCMSCTNCINPELPPTITEPNDLMKFINCKFCDRCDNCINSIWCFASNGCTNCVDCIYCYDCVNCTNCIGCKNCSDCYNVTGLTNAKGVVNKDKNGDTFDKKRQQRTEQVEPKLEGELIKRVSMLESQQPVSKKSKGKKLSTEPIMNWFES